MVSTTQEPTSPPATSSVFTRNATGLVRGVSPRAAFVFQFLGAHPAYPLAYGLFFSFALFPGGSFLIAGLLAMPLALSFAYSFGLLTSMLPRTGGDYLFVSRIISPTIGLISSFCMNCAQLLSLAFFGSAVTTLGIAPGLAVIGLVSHSDGLVNASATISTSHGWQFLIGSVLFILGALILMGGWKWTIRLQSVILVLLTISFLICLAAVIFTSHTGFVRDFNDFARPHTHLANTYQATIAAANKGGINTSPGFSFTNTIPMVGIFASFAIYTWFASYAGGELRRARATGQAHAMGMAGVTAIVLVALCAVLFIHAFGSPFLIAANGATGLPKGIAAAPTYIFLVSAIYGSTPLAVIIVLCFLTYFLVPVYGIDMTVTRTIFAFSFDGLLPRRLSAVDERTKTPWWALGITWVLTEITFLIALHLGNFFQILVYATLIQLVSMGLVGVCAAIIPYRKPELFRAGATQARVLGVPVVTVAGVCAILSAVAVYVIYFNWAEQFGLSNKLSFVYWLAGTIAAALVFYNVARFVQRRRGTDLALAYAEIPPE
jgi:APA family basic amino acid/polyamine antiporter